MARNLQRKHFRELNLGFSKTARQHFVPRFYLGNFADRGLVSVCDLDSGKQFKASTRDVGVTTGFNDLEVAGLTVSTEEWLAQIEGAAGAIIGRLAREPAEVLGLSDGEENTLSRFVAAQRFRVPAFRESENRLRASMVAAIKERTRGWLYNTEPRDEAGAIWAAWDAKADWWWLQESGPIQDARTATWMLGEVQGFANLLRAMPWRAGWVDSRSSLYTSDNPVSAYLPAVRPWWSGGGFADHAFFFPLSTRALLKIGSTGRRARLERRGQRSCEHFSLWETALARHVVTADAIRFLYGPGPYVSRECAQSCLRRLDDARLRDAIALQGFNPYPPGVSLD
jgi:hypothetical protein